MLRARRRVQRDVKPDPATVHSRAMDRRSALVLLAVFGTGVFLAGLELMITAVALPSILDDLADPAAAPPGSSCARRAGSSTATCWSTS